MSLKIHLGVISLTFVQGQIMLGKPDQKRIDFAAMYVIFIDS